MAEGYRRLFGVLAVLVAIFGATTIEDAGGGAGAYIASSSPMVTPPGVVTSVVAPEVTTTTVLASTTTTTAPPRLVATPVSTVTTSIVAPLITSTTAPVPATTSTSTVVPCRNSTDPACGAFRFDPQPGLNRPMSVHIVVAPSQPASGQEVEFEVTLTDPDGVSHAASTYNWGDSGIGESKVDPCTRFGPWDPPAPDPSRASEVLRLRHTYAQPGTYRVVFIFGAEPFACVDSVSGRGDRPYASSASGTVTIEVS